MIFFPGIVYSTGPIEFPISLYTTSMGRHSCDANSGIYGAPNVVLQILLSSWSVISSTASDLDTHSISFTSSRGDEYWSIVFRGVSFHAWEMPNRISYLGIGPDSEFLHRVGSIAIIKRRWGHEMVLGSLLSNFTDSCIPDTLLNITSTGSSGSSIGASFGLVSNSTHIEMLEDRDFYISSAQGFLGSVPAPIFDRIRDLILDVAHIGPMDRDDLGRVMFSNCTREIVSSLPSINVSLRRQTGSFFLLPEDYLFFFASRNECWLRLLRNNPSHPVWVDMLLIGGTNVRFNSDRSLQICDASEF